ncbi:hypothetical protein DE146DRAFT_627728 [Phaeosphaeria sp. MPI-PUGE-AT-0046c]|nr:hypothetical protein DE146DRAFT_627728 [Phaeosphaeria sp. MPI-PUGE-AT-0046c]
MSLPTTRNFIAQLLESLPSVASSTGENVNPLSAAPESAKNQLLTLQVLFPNEFLPALDLLDHGLVTRMSINDGEGKELLEAVKDAGAGEEGRDVDAAGPSDANMQDRPDESTQQTPAASVRDPHDELHALDTSSHTAPSTSKDAIYYVRSAQQRSSRYGSSYDTTTSYEVRLRAWNCSCPAFAFAAFPAMHPEPAMPMYDPRDDAPDERLADAAEPAWAFGGVSLGDAIPPVCKHLLACVLVEKCSGLFGSYVEQRVVSVEEAAGWAAGWGD